MVILLFNPPPPEPDWFIEPLGISSLATSLREAGHSVHLLDAAPEKLNIVDCSEAIINYPRIDLLGMTAMDEATFNSGCEVIQMLREKNFEAHIALGGYYPTLWSSEILAEFLQIDSVIIGEGELTVLELAGALEHGKPLKSILGLAYRSQQGIFQNPPRPSSKIWISYPSSPGIIYPQHMIDTMSRRYLRVAAAFTNALFVRFRCSTLSLRALDIGLEVAEILLTN
jgi:radical SAM superfamily enzyme YgiQ (UPF0313 family)